MDDIKELIDLLPNYEDLTNITEEELEARYIFKVTTSFFNKNKNSNTTNSMNLDELSYLVESLLEKKWEEINTGHFSEVSITTRKIYSLTCYFKIIFNLLKNERESEIEICNEYLDKAFLIGCTEKLYENSDTFLKELSKFLEQNQNTDLTLPELKPIEFKEFPCDISILNSPTVMEFNEKYFKLEKPLLIRNTISHWPALTKWRNLNYLLKIAGNRSVPIEIGSNYVAENWSQQLIKIKDFLKRQFGQNEPDNNIHEIEYLAQHELFDQIPELKKDIIIPDYCCCSNKINSESINEIDLKENKILMENEIEIKAWFGPQNTISPMHQDPKHNILCQVFGRKKIILASSSFTEFLYCHDSKMLNNTSQIDAENLNFEKFPLVKNVNFLHLILQEGECLYIPPKCWHYVRSLSKSFSVSFWWE